MFNSDARKFTSPTLASWNERNNWISAPSQSFHIPTKQTPKIMLAMFAPFFSWKLPSNLIKICIKSSQFHLNSGSTRSALQKLVNSWQLLRKYAGAWSTVSLVFCCPFAVYRYRYRYRSTVRYCTVYSHVRTHDMSAQIVTVHVGMILTYVDFGWYRYVQYRRSWTG